MMRPMPFLPSLEPCANDTPVQVRISRQRIQNGGGVFFFGSLYSAGTRTTSFMTYSSKPARMKPTSGENSSDFPTASAWPQSTPDVPDGPCIIWFISPTPITEPISVWELDEGIPSAEVPDDRGDQQREHHREALRCADAQNQLHRQQLQDAERNRAARHQHAEKIPCARPDDREIRRERMRIDDGGDGIGRIVETIYEFEPKRDHQCNAEQDVRQYRRLLNRLEVLHQMRHAINNAAGDDDEKQRHA